ncbi:MAG: DUF507 family protein [Nitrospirae bacterium]|nr:MAG: DUF507 family protein [Nitrospirota bacterium]
MMLSEDKISHLTHVLLKQLMAHDLIDLIEDESDVRREIKRTIVSELKVGEEIDEIVRKKLQSFSKKLIEGSPEWEVMYRKIFREEEIKRGRASG